MHVYISALRLCIVVTTAFVASSQSAKKKASRNHTGSLIFLHRDPIMRYSKRQIDFEVSTLSYFFSQKDSWME